MHALVPTSIIQQTAETLKPISTDLFFCLFVRQFAVVRRNCSNRKKIMIEDLSDIFRVEMVGSPSRPELLLLTYVRMYIEQFLPSGD